MVYQSYTPVQPMAQENKFMRIFNIISGWVTFALTSLALGFMFSTTDYSLNTAGYVAIILYANAYCLYIAQFVIWCKNGFRFNKPAAVIGFVLAGLFVASAILSFYTECEYYYYYYYYTQHYSYASEEFQYAGVFLSNAAAFFIASGIISLVLGKKNYARVYAAPQYAAPQYAPQYAAPQYAPQYQAPQYQVPVAPQYQAPTNNNGDY